MIPAACLTELPNAMRTHSFSLVREHPLAFLASGLSGCCVNLTSFMLVRSSGMSY